MAARQALGSGLVDVTAVRAGDCPQCGHDNSDENATPRNPSRLRALLGLRPRPAACAEWELDTSGWASSVRCECTDAFHGS